MKRIFSIIFILSVYFSGSSQNNKPKLVVGIIVDQMRYDYLTRFEAKYGEGGFKRLMREGFNCKNNHFNYIPTYTGPGHASVFTGTTPKNHGIIANDFYDKELKKMVYCAEDDSVLAVGSDSEKERMSPHRLKTTTFADENRLFTQMRGKTIGISIKDRGAVFPAGHTASAAYWFRGKKEGNFISSTYYMKELPKWVEKFNKSSAVKSYLKDWNTLYDISTYTESGEDLNPFEGGFVGKETPTFPYNLKALMDKNMGYDILKETAFGNSILADFAIEALRSEKLGKDEVTDVLTVSFSSTDYVGHRFGVNSKEIQDTYLRLDKDLERFLKALDEEVGVGNYTVFLTADHGAVHVPNFLKSQKIPAGYVRYAAAKKNLKTFLKSKFKAEGLIENVSNNQIFLNRDKIKILGLDLIEIQEAIVNEIIGSEEVYKVYSATTMSNTSFNTGLEASLQNGYNQKRSGDVLIIPNPSHIYYRETGTSHGSGFNYDTHVPLLFFGKGIKRGETFQKTVIPDIAPTISALLGISFPSGATGKPLGFILE
ncbi:MAG: alkaline phosphatase PafA [Jejuia sp.]